MALVELETDAAARAGRGSKRVSSRARRGGSRPTAPAAPGALGRAHERFHRNIWAPIALKLLGITGGMLVLAGIGASSIARGSGVPAATGAHAASASFLAGGLAPATATARAAPASDAGAPDASVSAPRDAAPPTASAGLTADGKVILNRASADELRRLPGVGAKRAHAIVALRERLGGRFKRVSELLRVKGIGPKGLRKMEPHLVLDG